MIKPEKSRPNSFQALRRVQGRVANSAQSLAASMQELAIFSQDESERRRILELASTFAGLACDLRARNVDLASLNVVVLQ